MLPKYGDEDENGCNEDECESGLRDGAGGEWFDFVFGSGGIGFFVPAGKGCEEDEAYECEDDSDDAR